MMTAPQRPRREMFDQFVQRVHNKVRLRCSAPLLALRSSTVCTGRAAATDVVASVADKHHVLRIDAPLPADVEHGGGSGLNGWKLRVRMHEKPPAAVVVVAASD